MDRRLELHQILKTVTTNVYFQPPESIKMQYPCIVYNREADQVERANDILYKRRIRYNVTVIDENPDSDIPNQLARLPYCRFERFYASDHLNHDVFVLYF